MYNVCIYSTDYVHILPMYIFRPSSQHIQTPADKSHSVMQPVAKELYHISRKRASTKRGWGGTKQLLAHPLSKANGHLTTRLRTVLPL